MPSKSVSASMTAVSSTPGNTEQATSPQPKKAQVIFLQRSPKLIISRNGGETVQHFVLTQQPIVNVSDFRSAPALTGTGSSASSDTIIIDTSSDSGTTVDTLLNQELTPTAIIIIIIIINHWVMNLAVPATTTATATTLKATTITAATEVGFLTSEAEGTVETVVVRSSDISDESQQLSLMDAYPVGQVTSTYLNSGGGDGDGSSRSTEMYPLETGMTTEAKATESMGSLGFSL
ncbi:hypothetical protein DINM_004831 [Dirofilaria immitis]|nr:hypothetical protein [Dirofilaria immitis]